MQAEDTNNGHHGIDQSKAKCKKRKNAKSLDTQQRILEHISSA
jgi:hypothetical protein